jgi:hypothetical protein
MRKPVTLCLVLAVGVFFAICGFAVDVDKGAIQKQVDEIVAPMNGGKTAADFKDAANRQPYYVFIMEGNGLLLVHPTLTGQNLNEKAGPVYNAVSKATPEGIWTDYEWQGKQKHSYVRKTKTGLIVGSGYSE